MSEKKKQKSKKQTYKGARFFDFRYIGHDFVKVTSAVPMLVMFRVKRLYENKNAKKKIKGGALLVSNHVGFMDPMILMTSVWYRRHHFVCLKIFFEGKKAFLFKQFQCIPIDRENMSFESINEITKHLKGGELVTMFPEGAIQQQEGMGSFKSGMCLLAMRANVPIVPIYIKKREHWWQRSVTAIGEPIDLKQVCGDKPALSQIEEVAKYVQEKTLLLQELAESH